MDREIRKGIKEEAYKRTGVSSTKFRQKNEDGSRYIGLCNRRGFINRV